MARTHIIAGAAVSVVLLIAGGAKAQGVSASFDALQQRLKTGARVVVKDQAGRETEGLLTSVTASAISIRVGNDQRTWVVGEVSELRRRGDSLKNGTLIGLWIGLGAGVGGGWCWLPKWEMRTGTQLAGGPFSL